MNKPKQYVITGVDTETTGLKHEKGDRIIEICFIGYLYTPDNGAFEKKFTWEKRFNPNKAISESAQAVHGISNADLINCKPFDHSIEHICKILEVTDYLVAHNMDFDGPFIVAELLKHIPPEKIPAAAPYCTMDNGRWATATGKVPNLRELCFACDVEYDASKAHAATYDVEVMMECFYKGLINNEFSLS